MNKKKLQKLYKICMDFSIRMKRNQLDIYSGATAFFLFVSIIPFIILLLSIIAYTPITDEDLYTAVLTILPSKLDAFAYDVMLQLSMESIATISFSAIGTMWLSAWGIQSLKKGLNRIHGVIETRNFVLLRLNALFYTILFLAAIVIIFVFNIFSNTIFNYIFSKLSENKLFSEHQWIVHLFNLRWLIVIGVSFFVCLYFFWALPNVKLTFRSQVPGAVFVAIIWYAFSKIFNIYINNFNAYNMYGSLSFIIIVMMWIYISMYIFFIGAQINYYLSVRLNKVKI